MSSLVGYRINEMMYESNNSLVYRGYREEDRQPVVLKMLKDTYPSPERIAWFRREYEVTHKLFLSTLAEVQTPAGIIEPYALESTHNRWVIVLEDFGGESLDRLNLAGRLSLPDFLKQAIDIATILGQIHQHYLIHKDLNPSNIVLNPATGQLKIIDFGISTLLSRENTTFRNPNKLEGTLAYISPEQTGRMNRGIDYRTDFYSLGVTFYQLLTGRLPFPTNDVLELVHAHIAQKPIVPHKLKADIPEIVSEIVLKLMAKNAEDRYQSAYGLRADLTECLHQWQENGRIESFSLGQEDGSDRFYIPQKLYGREREVSKLLEAFDQVSQGTSKMLLISGYAGVGKSSLVQEIYKPITSRRGYFITGKFDQLQRNIPYAALIQAFQSLVQQLLTETENEISAWREKLLAALGSNGQVIIDVIPDVELIIGLQPEVPDLSPMEVQARFNLVFQNFIKVFTQPEHPLVIFLDDAQWADGASLNLLELLMTAVASEYLFLISAYRDNEVNEGHSLRLALKRIEEAGSPVNHISLAPLALTHVVQLISGTLHRSREEVKPLAELVLSKTAGNPFFINEFLKSLHTEALLAFDFGQREWQWNLQQIQQRNITDNVVELMAGKVQRVPAKTQHLLKLAACIGNRFDLQTLATVNETSLDETAVDLWPALAEDLILPLSDDYKVMDLEVEGLSEKLDVEFKFIHDRVQQAVYSLIPPADRQALHWRIGHLLWQSIPLEEQEQKVFDLANQLNQGRVLIESQTEQDELVQLNLLAGQKAKSSAAYEPAFNYLTTGIELLTSAAVGGANGSNGQDYWQRQYESSLALHEEAAETAFLNGQFTEMEQLVESVLQNAGTLLDKVKVYDVRIQAQFAQSKYMEATQTGLEVLKLLGITFPEQPGPAEVMAALQETQATLGGRTPEDLINLPNMTNPDMLAAMTILGRIFLGVFVSWPELFPLLVCTQVDLSVKHGHTAESVAAYTNYAIFQCSVLGDFDTGYQFGQLALQLLERLNAQRFKAQTYVMLTGYVRHWKEHIRDTLLYLYEGYESGLATGDTMFGANCLVTHPIFSCLTGRELAEIEREMANSIEVVVKLKQGASINALNIYRQFIMNLSGEADNPCRLIGEAYNEETMLPLHLELDDHAAIFSNHFIKGMLCYLFQEFQQAADLLTSAIEGKQNQAGAPFGPVSNFYHALAHLAIFSEATETDQESMLEKVTVSQAKMKTWAEHAPMNYLHKFYLVEAERARVLGNDQEARDYYDRAIELAHEHEYLNEEALAYELAARFYLEREQTRIAGYYLRDAHYTYQRWGALAKVKDLEEKYPQLLAQTGTTLIQTTTSTTSTTGTKMSSALDLTSVLKASQAISGEIELDKLLTKLMSIVIENAGAQRGYLVLRKNGHWVIEAEGTIEEVKTDGQAAVTALQSIPIETCTNKLSPAIVNYVARTREDVVLNDAAQEGLFTQDPYVTQNQPKSVLCTPLINQGKLTGILYLENNLTTGAFTADRLEVLKLLSAQAAISIENASLYSHQVALTTGYSRFVPPEFLRFLNKGSIVDINLGDHMQQEMAVLFSDIRAFTTLSETMTPQENFDFVNAYFGRVSPIIRQYNGIIVKYLGDGMMAVFPQRVEDALNASIEKVKQVNRFNQDRQQQGEPPIKIGVGIHAGKMMLGTVGEAERMQSDFLSDAVNLTARLEGLTKLYGASIVISQEALNRIKDPTQYQFRFLDRVRVKGRQEAVAVFELFGGEPEAIVKLKRQTKTKFEEGLTFYYGQKFAAAGELFKDVLRHNPDDQAAKLYLERSEHYQAHDVPADWAGVRVLHEK